MSSWPLLTSQSSLDSTKLSPALTTGKVLQVVTATDSSGRSTTSTSFVTASNTLSVDITPSATSSKILIQISGSGRQMDV